MKEYDVVVLGTGAAGLVAAMAAADQGATVGLFEKSDLVGGTTALSGGVVWLPANKRARAHGVVDDREKALAYLEALSNDTMESELVESFVDSVNPMVDWLDERTPLELKLVAGYPDYHPEHPGGLPGGGRSLEPELFDVATLGAWADRLAGAPRHFYIREIPSGGGSGVIADDITRHRIEGHLEGLGRALVAALLRGCLDRGIEPHTATRATELITEGNRVCGVSLETDRGPAVVRARRGVVLATGGFEHDQVLIRSFLRGPIRHSPGVATNTGDGLRMAMGVGAELGNMPFAWWVPVVLVPGADGAAVPTLLLRERTLPGTIMINSQGRRFTNEAANYNALGAAFQAFDVSRFRYANDPAWLVIGQDAVDRYGVFGYPPGHVPGWLIKAASVAELAEAVGATEPALVETIDNWNKLVANGRDEQFGRGESAYDGWCGDHQFFGTPQATLGSLGSTTFFVTQVHPSALGTKGGPRTTEAGQVIGLRGDTVPGLYAAGNVMSAPTGMVYGGAGGTLGPAMVFGYLAGQAAALDGSNV
jgi:3-oxosteroid 1-dehydrogenase